MEPVAYIERIRDYYLGQGYEKPYDWAHFDEVPFAALEKPLAECRVALVSTSDIAARGHAESEGGSGQTFVGNVYSIPSETPVAELYSHQEHYDAHATTLDDIDSFFPITRLHEAARAGRIGGVAARSHGVYTSYSHRRTLEEDGPEVVRRCAEDGVDAVVLTPV
jgi:hypothetical protein